MNDEKNEFKSRKSGFTRWLNALRYSFDGFSTAWKNENAFREEIALLVVGSIIAFILPVPIRDTLLLIGVLILLLIVELINSAIEETVDRISLEQHPLSKNAKDLGSAAVFLTLILAAIVWCVILYPVVIGWLA